MIAADDDFEFDITFATGAVSPPGTVAMNGDLTQTKTRRGLRCETWWLSATYRDHPAGRCFVDLDAVFRCKGEAVSRDPVSHVKRVTLDNTRYYVKIYTGAGKWLRRLLGRSRVQAEWENLQLFRSLGIPTPPIVAYGLERTAGIFRRGALVTQEVEDTADLNSHVRAHPELLQDRQWVDAVIGQVADYTRRMHDAGFAHNDLNWRNILVTRHGPPQVFFIDCPSGRHWPWPLLARKITKDLAHLDKVGRQLLSPRLSLRFYKRYARTSRLSAADKRWIARILRFHDKRRARKRRRENAAARRAH